MMRYSITGFLLSLLLQPVFATAEQQRFNDYFEALPVFWDNIYADGGETLYCNQRFGRFRGHNINIEHVFPMAWVVRAEGCRSRKLCRQNSARFNRIEADMHNLYPALASINKARSSFPFAEIAGEQRAFGQCDFEFHNRRRAVEPTESARGNIARAMFYMHQTYGLPIYRSQGKMLKRWNHSDPPDREERRRNNLIQRYQGNRNPFIDQPALADQLRF